MLTLKKIDTCYIEIFLSKFMISFMVYQLAFPLCVYRTTVVCIVPAKVPCLSPRRPQIDFTSSRGRGRASRTLENLCYLSLRCSSIMSRSIPTLTTPYPPGQPRGQQKLHAQMSMGRGYSFAECLGPGTEKRHISNRQ